MVYREKYSMKRAACDLASVCMQFNIARFPTPKGIEIKGRKKSDGYSIAPMMVEAARAAGDGRG